MSVASSVAASTMMVLASLALSLVVLARNQSEPAFPVN